MKFLQSFKPFELITALAERNLPLRNNKSEKPTSQQVQQTTDTKNQQPFDPIFAYQQAEGFILSLRKTMSDQKNIQNAKIRKINIFEKVSIQPHYLQEIDSKKLLEFQFHLGSDIFLDRIELLYEQIVQIDKVIVSLSENKNDDVWQFFNDSEEAIQRTILLITKIKQQRELFRQTLKRKQYSIKDIQKKKDNIKKKINLLKKVKQKNEVAFLQINNIDQAFATEQTRVKLYKKLLNLSELEKSKYVMAIKQKLISTAKANKLHVQKGIIRWTSQQLTSKQIEKLAFMIYFMEKEEIYRQNKICVDFNKFNKKSLLTELTKIYEWKQFHYIKDFGTKDKINQFITFLINKIG